MQQLTKTFLTALIALSLSASMALANTKIGVVGAANPDVKATSEAGDIRTLKTGDAIFLNDEITTSAAGAAQLMFLDKSALTISPESKIKIDTFVYNPAAKDGTMSMQSAKGAFRFIGGALTKKKPVKIKTPVSTIGIRGGIVDAHIAENGPVEAIFIFGEELTFTGLDGETTSVTEFGTGLTVDGANARPQPLPKPRIQQRLNRSPVKSAVGTTQSGGNNDGGAVNKKVNINTAPTGGDQGGSSDNGADGDANNQGSAPSGQTNQNSNNNGAAFGGDANDDNAADPLTDTNSAELAGDGTNDGNNTPPLDGGVFGAFGVGEIGAGGTTDGVETVGLTNPNETAQEDLRNDVNEFVENKGAGQSDGSGPTFDVTGIDDDTFNNFLGINPTDGDNSNGGDDGIIDPTIGTDGTDQDPINDGDRDPTDLVDDLLGDDEDDTTIGGIITPPGGGGGGGNPPRDNSTESVSSPTFQGFFASAVRDNTSGAITGYADDGDLIAEERNAGADFLIELEAANAAPDIHDVEIKKATSMGSIAAADVGYWESGGEVDGWAGDVYVTSNNAFHYYLLERVDTASETQYLRMVLLDSDIFDDGGAGYTDLNAAKAAISNAVSESMSHAFGLQSHGIIEYTFLRDLMGDFDSNGTDRFGAYNYSGIGAGNATGLLVDYDRRQFMGADFNFLGANPGMIFTAGNIDENRTTVDGFFTIDGGNFFEGYTFSNRTKDLNADTYIKADEFGGNEGSFIVQSDTIGYKETAAANDLIEGMIVEGTLYDTKLADPGHDVHQGLVYNGTPANTFDTLNVGEGVDYKGFSAGLVMKHSGETSRIKTAGLDDMAINVDNVAGEMFVDTTINAAVIDDVGTFGSSIDLTEAANTQAAIADDMYGTGLVGGSYEGALVTAKHISDATVCSTCTFAHWGVWSIANGSQTPGTIGDNKFTGLVPYVAGEVYDVVNGTNAGGGVHTFSGDIAANKVFSDGVITNEMGTFNSTINLNNRRVQAYNGNVGGMNFGFNATNATLNGVAPNLLAGSHSALDAGTTTGGYEFGEASDMFSAEIGRVDGGGGAYTDFEGNMNGALFGTNAEEFGGNFYIKDLGPDQAVGGGDDNNMAGIFLGKR